MVQESIPAVIYARVSRDDQNCQRQINDLTAFAQRAGYEVVQVIQEKASGAKNDREQRKEVMKLAQKRLIKAVLVTEMSRWGRSLPDLLATLQQLMEWNCSVVAATGFTFDLSSSQGKLMAGILGSLAEFERDLLRERVKSGLATAVMKGKKLGRQHGQNPSDKIAPKVMKLVEAGDSYRLIADKLNISKTTVTSIVKRQRQTMRA